MHILQKSSNSANNQAENTQNNSTDDNEIRKNRHSQSALESSE